MSAVKRAVSAFVIVNVYRHILIPLENSASDDTILGHIKPLARLTGAKLLLVHGAGGSGHDSLRRQF